jgi:hypothetical protein
MAFAVLAGAGSLVTMISLDATGERLVSPAASRARRRAVAQPAPAPKTPCEAAPEPVTPRGPGGTRTRPRARLSSTPS